MKTKFNGFLTLLLAFVVQISFAQSKTISGTITDESALPLPGVSVIIKGTTTGVETDFDGNYSINANTGDVLSYSYIGYKTKEMTVGASSNISFAMQPDVSSLEEVTIVAYAGAVENSKIASSVATVSGETLEQIPVASLDQILQGAAAGVSVNTGSGQPGQSATIIIRGRQSIRGDIEPLYVIDGVPVDGDNFRSLNPNDIATYSVLKDASATAIYGNRGAGGVILITTKTGKRNTSLQIQYRSLYGIANRPKKQFDVMNASQFLTFQRDLLPGNQYGDTLSDAEIAAIASQTNTNWLDIFIDNGTTTSHEMTFTSGGEKSSSFSSLQFYRQEGITLGSDLQRFSFRNNYNGSSADDKFNYSTSVTLNHSSSNFIVDAARGGNTGGQLDNPFLVPYIGLPYYTPYNPDGSINVWGLPASNAFNADGSLNANGANGFLNTPFIALNTARFNTDRENEVKAIGRIQGSYNFAKNFTATALFGLDYTNIELLQITDPRSIRGLLTPTQASEDRGSHTESFFRNANFSTYASVRYENDITEKLNLNTAVFAEYNYTNTQRAGFTAFGLNPALPGSGSGFTAGDTVENPNGGPDVYNYIPGVSSSETEIALGSIFSTLDLDYDNRFGLSASVRKDFTSRFPKNESGVFWSVAGRWNIDNESFVENADWLSTLKLRVSYGVVGNQNVGNRYQGLQTVNAEGGYQNTVGYAVTTLVDENIQWETTNQFNTGVSFGFWNNRLSGELDFYRNVTEGLFGEDVRSPSNTGFPNVTNNLAGVVMSNTGVDLQIGYDILRKSDTNPWNIKVFANANYNKNKVDRLDEFTGSTLRVVEGRPAFTWFMPRWAGVDPSNGQPLYLDVNGNVTNVYDPDNAVYLDKNFDPTYTGGFGTDISFKGFTLNTLFSFSADRWRQNSSLAIIEDAGLAGFANMSTSLLNAWTTPGQVTDIPALSYGGLRAVDGDRYIEDASYLRLRNVTLAYNLDKKVLDKINFLKGLRVYVQGTNLFTWTKWRGYDPEGNGATAFFDYPVPKTYTIGFDINF